jgi:hypothetical protein
MQLRPSALKTARVVSRGDLESMVVEDSKSTVASNSSSTTQLRKTARD